MPLPELLPDVDDGDPDAQIVYGAVPAELADPSLVGTRFQAVERIKRAARFRPRDLDVGAAALLARFLAGVGVLALPAEPG